MSGAFVMEYIDAVEAASEHSVENIGDTTIHAVIFERMP